MRVLCFSLCCLFYSVSATASVDLEKTMKNMAFQYKQAYDAQSAEQLLPLLDELITLTQQSAGADFAADKAEQFKQGLQQVLAELQLAKQAAEQDDVAQARLHLQQVDALRKEYHQQRKVSIWRLLFG
ncbi:cytochrome b562 [Rheinheimera sp.]|uniref:cytochrome b562 n=1 Tax=Rheinheimera sp. TaxID=1869214 RepID=UPI00273519E5|nr:cytochrome b562 [Rheinheimera sp.]MDP2715372.1 cytochrome b562 [Rheinheimera sp.]